MGCRLGFDGVGWVGVRGRWAGVGCRLGFDGVGWVGGRIGWGGVGCDGWAWV